MNPRRPGRSGGGPSRDGGGGPSSEENPAQTNLGLLLQRALQQQAAQSTQQTVEPEAAVDVEEQRETKLCANCWNALTFKDERGRMMARCGKDLWVRAAYTVDDLNGNKIRRWYIDCPEYDDSE